MSRRVYFAILATLVLALTGCGSSGPKKFDVTGTVKYDGKDVEDGFITFTPDDKTVGPEAGPIKNGKYTVKANGGKNKVKIQANRLVPGKKGPMGEDAIEPYIPTKYNDSTTLEVDIGAGKTEHNFDLKP